MKFIMKREKTDHSLEVDIHVHTIASGHGLSTLSEIRKIATKRKIRIVGIADHGPSMRGASHLEYFTMGDDVRRASSPCCKFLFGCEANIQSQNGDIDIPPSIIQELDYLLAGIHNLTPYTQNSDFSRHYHTDALINCIKNVKPTAITHPIYPLFPIDVAAVVTAAATSEVVLEINARVLRRANEDIICEYQKLIECAAKCQCYLMLSSDSHFVDDVGDVTPLKKLEVSIKAHKELIINYSVDSFNAFWGKHQIQDIRI